MGAPPVDWTRYGRGGSDCAAAAYESLSAVPGLVGAILTMSWTRIVRTFSIRWRYGHRGREVFPRRD